MAEPEAEKKPVFQLEKTMEEKWIVDNQRNREDLLIDETKMKQAVFVNNCVNCTLNIKGKVKRVVLNSCEKVALVFDSIVTGLEIYNSKRIQAQVNGVLPGILVVRTERCQVFLNKDSMQCEVSTSCSSLVNVSYPKEDGNHTLYHVPEQLKTTWNGKEYVTEVDKQFLE